MGYARPDTLSDALEVLAGGARTILAGGTDLYPATTAQSLPGDILDITAIKDLRGITQDAAGVRIGASTTWSDIIVADLPPAFDALKAAAAEVGARQIQNAGTIAGNICNASPAADGAPALMVLDAEVEISAATGKRLIPLQEFITGVRRTTLRPDEMVTALHIPAAATHGRSAFVKLGARKHLVISIAMIAARIETHEDRITTAAIAVGACSAVALRLTEVETRLIGQPIDAMAKFSDADIAATLSPIDDIRGSADYRRHAAATLVRRAVEAAL